MNSMSCNTAVALACVPRQASPIATRRSFTPGAKELMRPVSRRISCRATLTIKAFKESSKIQDWRVEEMVKV